MALVAPAAIAADFNADGRDDLVWRNGSGENAIWLMNGFQVTGVPIQSQWSTWKLAGVGDFNGDGGGDLLWYDTISRTVTVWLFNGTTFTTSGDVARPGVGWTVIATGDTNADGKTDVILRHSDTAEVVVWLMNGTSIIGSGTVAFTPTEWQPQGAGDANGDGRADLFWRNTNTNELVVWFLNGSSILGSGTIAYIGARWSSTGIGDWNGDGRVDMSWRHKDTSEVYVWLLNGSVITGSGLVAVVTRDWEPRGVGDTNGDGRDDMIWRKTETGQNAVWLMNGAQVPTGDYIVPVADPAWSLYESAKVGPFTQCFGTMAADAFRTEDGLFETDERTMNYNDYGMFFHDALNPNCSAAAVASRLTTKLRTTPPSEWKVYFGGAILAFVLKTGLELGGRGSLTEELDAAIRDTIAQYEFNVDPSCGISGNRYGAGNACFDDYTLALSGYGWIVAYQRLTGRNYAYAREQFKYVLGNAFHQSQSICIHDPNRPPDVDYDANGDGDYNDPGDINSPTDRGFCNGPYSSLGTGGRILSLNHGNQTPAYGIGLMASVASAFAGIDVAETPIRSQDWSSDQRLLMEWIFVEAREKSTWEVANGNFNFENAGDESCYDIVETMDSQYLNLHYALQKPLLCGDALFNASSEELGRITRYRANMYPVKSFYERYGLRTNLATAGFSYGPGTFAETFADASDPLTVRRWFGPIRRAAYKVVAGDWTHSWGRPPLYGRDEYKISLGAGINYWVMANGGGSTINTTGTVRDAADSRLILTDVNGGTLRDGDIVTIRTPSGYYLTAVGGGGSTINATRPAVDPMLNYFTIRKASGVGGLISDRDAVSLLTSNGYYVNSLPNSTAEPTAYNTSPVAYDSQDFVRIEY